MTVKSFCLFVKDPHVQGLVRLFLKTRETKCFGGLPSLCSATLLWSCEPYISFLPALRLILLRGEHSYCFATTCPVFSTDCLQSGSLLKTGGPEGSRFLQVLHQDLAPMNSAAVPESPRLLPNSLPTCAGRKKPQHFPLPEKLNKS